MLNEKIGEKIINLLSAYGVSFGNWLEHIGGHDDTIGWIAVVMILVVIVKNSNEYAAKIKMTATTYIVILTLYWYSIVSMTSSVSEFLYFNF